MEDYRLLLLGPPEVLIDRQATRIRIRLRKALALVAYLAVEDRAFSREYLATLLWPNLGQTRALANLRHTLALVRETFQNGCIITDGDQIELNRSFIQIDIDEFHSRAHSPDTDIARLEAASEVYRSSFMEGFNLGDCEEFDEWQGRVRRRFESELDELLETLVTACLQIGRPRDALPFARRWLDLDDLNEAAHRALMEAYARSGRSDLARKQFESCSGVLAGEGLEPEESTRELHDAIVENRLTPPAGGARSSAERTDHRTEAENQARPRGSRRWLVYLGALVLAAMAIAGVGHLGGFFGRSDFMVTDLEVLQTGDEFSGVLIGFRGEGTGRREADFSIFFSGNPVIGAAREFLVYSSDIRIGWNREENVYVDSFADIQQFVDAHDVRIPPGNYSLGVVINSRTRSPEPSEFNNRLRSSDRVFFGGATAVETLDVLIRYSGRDPLGADDPLKVFVADLTNYSELDTWAEFTVTETGRYFFPLDDVHPGDDDGSGYFVLIVHDAGANLENSNLIVPDFVGALSWEAADDIVLSGLHVAIRSPVFPGESISFEVSRPPPPAPDIYETTDNEPLLGTILEYDDLPVRQYHTFHGNGDAEMDEDWFRVFLKAGDSLTVETFSAGDGRESQTAIDVADSEMNYIGSSPDKYRTDYYSELIYVNDTGIDQVFHFCVKPYNQYSFGVDGSGEYIVEFRR